MNGTQGQCHAALKRKRQKWWQAAAGKGVGPGH